mmetsp:Transcript_6052/g.7274  ORF Transcript_6052/g.7274 Transcript_6052/m.7274 type:complete len:89 (+) Transcript_6052:48-314(+)
MQSKEQKAAVLATICFAIKDCQSHDFSDDFWRELNTVLRSYLREQGGASRHHGSAGPDSASQNDETLLMIKQAIGSNRRLDDSLLRLF